MNFEELSGATERALAARRVLEEFGVSEGDATLLAKHLADYENVTNDGLRRQ